MTDHVEAGVLKIVSETVCEPVDKLKSSDNLETLKIDSLDVIEISMRVEEEYEIEFSDEDLSTCQTVGDLIALTKRLRG